MDAEDLPPAEKPPSLSSERAGQPDTGHIKLTFSHKAHSPGIIPSQRSLYSATRSNKTRLPEDPESSETVHYEPDEYVLGIPGLVRLADGRIPGYIPGDQYNYYLPEDGTPDYNRNLIMVMGQTDMHAMWCRVAHFGSQHNWNLMSCLLLPLYLLLLVSTLGLVLLCDRRMFCGSRGSLFGIGAPKTTYLDRTVGIQGRGWAYVAVPEIKIDWEGAYATFQSQDHMEKVGMATCRQRGLEINELEKSPKQPFRPTVAPGGGWEREWERKKGHSPHQRIRLRFNNMWVFMYDRRGQQRHVKSIEHGVRGDTTVAAAAEALFTKERETMKAICEAGFKGRAVAIWPPIEILD